MLESEIKGLKEEVALLRETIQVLISAMGHNGQAPAMPAEAGDAGDAAEDTAAPVSSGAEPATTTADEVQTLCMTIVRKDRSKKTKVKELIAEFGAPLVKDVPADKLPELKAKLEAL